MANKVITFVIDTLEPKLDAILAAAIDEIHLAGHKIREIRIADDSGEVKVAPNTVEGVTLSEPVDPTTEPAPVEPTPAPVETPPEDVPVDPTEVVSSTESATA